MLSPVYITGIGAFLPNAPIPNNQIENIIGRINGQDSPAGPVVLDNNKIVSRHYAIDPQTGQATHTNVQMTVRAIERALENSRHRVTDLELLSCGTASPDVLAPGHASMVHGELKGRPMEATSFSGVCACGMSSMRYAFMSVQTEQVRLAAATGSELFSIRIRADRYRSVSNDVDAKTMASSPIMGFDKEFLRYMVSDGAGCVIMSGKPRSEGRSLRVDWIDGISLANEYATCMYIGGMKDRKTGAIKGWLEESDIHQAVDKNYFVPSQDIRLLKDKITQASMQALMPIVEKRGLRFEEYDWFLPHLSSFYFKNNVMNAIKNATGYSIPDERVFTNLATAGNTGSASIYVMLEEGWRTDRFKVGEKILCMVPESGRFTFYLMQLTVT